jgi:predicted RNA-binding Zn ribbon-like protein
MEDRSVGLFEFNSGRLCLDFTNTVRARPLSDRIEYINQYSHLVSWARQATIITPGEAALLGEEAARRPKPAGEALSQALAVREAIHGLFSARATGLPASASDLRTLNRAIGRGMSHAGLVVAGPGFEWAWPEAKLDLDRITWWVSRSAAELLTSADLPLVRECAGYDCGWLFMDTTKNRSRRWCDMTTCGNRAKGRRHYERRRATGGSRPPDGQG